MPDAAPVTGTAAHALDYDDFSSVFGGHQSAPILPAVFALAKAGGHGGASVMTACAVGVETEIRIARAVQFHHYDKGWHPTATLGTFGSAAACAHLMGLSEAQIAMALALAVSQATGVKANFGTMTKPFHVGQCARAGLLSALPARQGFTANPATVAHPQGFFEVFNGAGSYDPARIFANWAAPLELKDDSIAIKPYPCSGRAHAAIRDRGIAALLAKLTARPHPDMGDYSTSQWAAEVIGTTRTGAVLSYRIDDLMAEGGALPLATGGLARQIHRLRRRHRPCGLVGGTVRSVGTLRHRARAWPHAGADGRPHRLGGGGLIHAAFQRDERALAIWARIRPPAATGSRALEAATIARCRANAACARPAMVADLER